MEHFETFECFEHFEFLPLGAFASGLGLNTFESCLIQSLLESLKKQTYDQWPEKSHRPGLFKSPINSDLVLDSMISLKHAKKL